jgi:hypothetical protein
MIEGLSSSNCRGSGTRRSGGRGSRQNSLLLPLPLLPALLLPPVGDDQPHKKTLELLGETIPLPTPPLSFSNKQPLPLLKRRNLASPLSRRRGASGDKRRRRRLRQ